MDHEPYRARKTPCASCPYRRDCPSGVWAKEEYESLKKFDGDILAQLLNDGNGYFLCHQTNVGEDSKVCAGWLGHRDDPTDLLGVRTGLSYGWLDPSVAEYKTSVALFSSGAEAAEHGEREIDNPSEKAMNVVEKIVRKRGLDV